MLLSMRETLRKKKGGVSAFSSKLSVLSALPSRSRPVFIGRADVLGMDATLRTIETSSPESER